MKKLLHSQKGQSFVELVLVLFLFTLFILGVTQLVMIGSAQIKCEIAARRASWIVSEFNHLGMGNGNNVDYDVQIKSLLRSSELNYEHHGNQDNGQTTTVKMHVPAIGFFHAFKPGGFDVSATNSVISYNPKPLAAEGIDIVVNWAKKQLGL